LEREKRDLSETEASVLRCRLSRSSALVSPFSMYTMYTAASPWNRKPGLHVKETEHQTMKPSTHRDNPSPQTRKQKQQQQLLLLLLQKTIGLINPKATIRRRYKA
jgi:hypothetical protein